uniref:Glucosamine-6-phosphate isomerase n=1 Tax=Trichuris muris TaxID=70415 RepID=A0A5S6QMW2_TRIMR
MKVVILDTADEVCEFAAQYVKRKILEFQPGPERYFTIGLPSGGTVLGMYRRLVSLYRAGELSFEFVKTFNMDEYIGIPKTHPQSYHYYMYYNFFRYIDIQSANVHILDGNASDFERESAEFEKQIQLAGGIQLFVGGIGPDGHIAFNEPGSSLVSRTRVKMLTAETAAANARYFNNDLSQVPKTALTVGVGTIMDAKEVMILASGTQKARAIKHVIEKGVNHMWTASMFQMHPNAMVVCDEDSTMELKVKTVKYFKSQSVRYMSLLEERPSLPEKNEGDRKMENSHNEASVDEQHVP